MKSLFWIGIVTLVLGALSFVIRLPRDRGNTVSVGGLSINVETRDSEKLPPLFSAALILVGAGFMIAGKQRT